MTDIRVQPQWQWLVIGWFTPDYRLLAEKFAANLDRYGAPYHLFAKPKRDGGEWDTRRKPTVVLEAMDLYPGKTLVMMDVDCIVKGDIAPATEIGVADVAMSIKARRARRNRENLVTLMVGSCVAVFRPTEGARAFAEEWARRCDSPDCTDDEGALVWAYAMRPDIRFAHLDQRFAGQEIGVPSKVTDIVVWHEAAHHTTHWASLRGALRLFERRFFRTGKTKAAAQRDLAPEPTKRNAPDA